MQGSFEGIQQSSSKDGVVGIRHVHDVKDYLFFSSILWGGGGTKGNGQCYHSDQLDSFSTKVI
jgi:hypothetical protein